jgi:hypothetical protein
MCLGPVFPVLCVCVSPSGEGGLDYSLPMMFLVLCNTGCTGAVTPVGILLSLSRSVLVWITLVNALVHTSYRHQLIVVHFLSLS